MHPWLVFHILVLAFLAIDLGLFGKRAGELRLKEALLWSLFWIGLGLSYALYIDHILGRTAALEYLSAYIVEKSLSIDNLFLFALIFESFNVQRRDQRKLLYWGILGAICFRALMIFSGTELINRFHWVHFIFGTFLIITGARFFFESKKALDAEKSRLLRFVKKIFPIREHPKKTFFFWEKGRLWTTPLFLVLVVIEGSDIVFALDSVPAVLGLSRSTYVVYTSNVFAILGLRSLFFVLDDLLDRFWLLKRGLSVILVYVGAKMIFDKQLQISPAGNLLAILGILGLTALLSLILPAPKKT